MTKKSQTSLVMCEITSYSVLILNRGSILVYGVILLLHDAIPGRVAQLVTCLATDACLTAIRRGREFDPGPVPYFRGD